MADAKTMHLTARVKDQARRLGFELVGITGPEPLPHIDVYKRWLSEDRHGGMSYLASERALAGRTNLRSILPECQSIVVVGANYLTDRPHHDERIPQARVAAYALGDNYHTTLVSRLRDLVSFIEAQVGGSIPHRIYTDTGPILERELAQRAGLGWIGKNTCLIHPNHGSQFLLAEVLLGIQLQEDDPFQHDRCGSCTRCIDACPTACILPDRTLDARRCISYLTIEEKAAVPRELRSMIDHWLFGCDLCQLVCPWNQRFSKATDDPAFQPRALLDPPDLEYFLTLSTDMWKKRLLDSPLLRPKRRGLVRNAAIVAGNAGDPNLILPLRQILLNDPEPLARSHAAWALGQIKEPRAIDALTTACRLEKDKTVIDEINAALSLLGS
jgi:epoxyqueuosine reductase